MAVIFWLVDDWFHNFMTGAEIQWVKTRSETLYSYTFQGSEIWHLEFLELFGMTYDRLVEFVDWKRFFFVEERDENGACIGRIYKLGLMWILQLRVIVNYF